MQILHSERSVAARATLDLGEGREVELRIRQHQGALTVSMEASSPELSHRLAQAIQELSRSLEGLDVGRGRLELNGALVGQWSGQRGGDERREGSTARGGAAHAPPEERQEEDVARIIRHAEITGRLHIVT